MSAHPMQISKEFMTYKDYFDLKSFSYFPRSFKYADFLKIVRITNPEMLSFNTSHLEKKDITLPNKLNTKKMMVSSF